VNSPILAGGRAKARPLVRIMLPNQRTINVTAERVKAKAHKDAPEKTSVVHAVPGITVEADDDDGAGLERALSTLAAMVSDG
jgi:hypothetical protein